MGSIPCWPTNYRVVAQVARAVDFDSTGSRFKSERPFQTSEEDESVRKRIDQGL